MTRKSFEVHEGWSVWLIISTIILRGFYGTHRLAASSLNFGSFSLSNNEEERDTVSNQTSLGKAVYFTPGSLSVLAAQPRQFGLLVGRRNHGSLSKPPVVLLSLLAQ